MSQIFYESDNMTITGGVLVYSGLKVDDTCITTGNIRLLFSIHINGKLKTFGHDFELARHQIFSEPSNGNDPQTYYSLKDWSSWNTLHSTLQSLGYMLDTRTSVMNTWTSNIGYDCDRLGVNTEFTEDKN